MTGNWPRFREVVANLGKLYNAERLTGGSQMVRERHYFQFFFGPTNLEYFRFSFGVSPAIARWLNKTPARKYYFGAFTDATVGMRDRGMGKFLAGEITETEAREQYGVFPCELELLLRQLANDPKEKAKWAETFKSSKSP